MVTILIYRISDENKVGLRKIGSLGSILPGYIQEEEEHENLRDVVFQVGKNDKGEDTFTGLEDDIHGN